MSRADAFAMTWEQAVAWLRSRPELADVVVAGYYDDPLPDAARRYHASAEWQAIRELLAGRRGRALDIGAGRGITSHALAVDGFAVTALEPDPSALVGAAAIRSLAAATGVAIDLVSEFSETLPFGDAEFDVVFGRAVLHHTRDLRAATREMARVLKPGGVLIMVREHVISRRSDLPAFLAAHPLHHLYGGENAFLLAEYVGALRSAGLRMVRILTPLSSPINYHPQDGAGLRRELSLRMARIVGTRSFWETLLRHDRCFAAALAAGTWLDRRPGRLYSFVCDKSVV